MEIFVLTCAMALFGYLVASSIRHERSRSIDLKFHLIKAKQILKNDDLKDKREWYIEQFKADQKHITSETAASINKFEFRSITDFRENLHNFQSPYN